jgi:hypothetical protein
MARHEKSVEGLCFAYQQNIPLLAVTTGELFYLRQVWVYNMGIYSWKTGCTKMYMYDETAGKKAQTNLCHSKNTILITIYLKKLRSCIFSMPSVPPQKKWWPSFKPELLHQAGSLKVHHHFPECGHYLCPVISHLYRLRRLNGERIMFLYQKNGVTVESVSSKFPVERVDQGVILDFKLHLQWFLKKIIKNKTASFTASRYENWFMKE